MTAIITSVTNIRDQLVTADDSLGSTLKPATNVRTYGTMGVQVFYGVVILFSFFAILGALLTACCDKYGCRHLMYFSCIFLFIIALFGFFISIILSIFVPLTTWACDFLDTTFKDQAGFSANMNPLLGSSSGNLSPCMPFGSGNIVGNLTTGGSLNGLNNLTALF